MKRTLFTIILAMLLATPLFGRTWHHKGVPVEGELVSAEGNIVTISKATGGVMIVLLHDLSEMDRAYIAANRHNPPGSTSGSPLPPPNTAPGGTRPPPRGGGESLFNRERPRADAPSAPGDGGPGVAWPGGDGPFEFGNEGERSEQRGMPRNWQELIRWLDQFDPHHLDPTTMTILGVISVVGIFIVLFLYAVSLHFACKVVNEEARSVWHSMFLGVLAWVVTTMTRVAAIFLLSNEAALLLVAVTAFLLANWIVIAAMLDMGPGKSVVVAILQFVLQLALAFTLFLAILVIVLVATLVISAFG